MAGKGYLYKLGPIVFNIEGAAPTTVGRSTDYRWVMQDRLMRNPAHQWLGPGADNFTFEGTIYPSYNPFGNGKVVGAKKIEEIRAIAAQGLPLDLTDGAGNAYGKWVIKSVEERREVMLDNSAPRRQGFTMAISFYGEDAAGTQGIIMQGGQPVAGRTPTGAAPGAGSPAVILAR